MLCFNYVYITAGALITERQRPSRVNSHKTQISGRDTQIAPFFLFPSFGFCVFCFVLLCFFAYLIMLIIKTRNKSKTTNKSDSLLGLFAKFRGTGFRGQLSLIVMIISSSIYVLCLLSSTRNNYFYIMLYLTRVNQERRVILGISST